MITLILFSIFLAFLIYGFIYLNKLRHTFKERNVKHLKPMFLFGNSLDVILGNCHNCEVLDRVYRAFPEEDVVGHLDLMMAQFVARSPDLVESILVKDFSHFHDRIIIDGEIETPDDADMFILTGNTWRAVRSKISPLFTSGKLKYMYKSISDCEKNLETVLDSNIGQELDMSDTMGLFALDVIGSTAFGIEPSMLQNPDSMFRKMALKINGGSLLTTIQIFVGFYFPKLASFFKIRGFSSKDVSQYFFDVISSTMDHRKKNGIERNDFVQMLLQLKEKGKVEVQIHDSGDDYLMLEKANDTFELEMSDNILLGVAFTFLGAGFHTTAMTLAYSLYQLSQNPEVTEKVKEEIRQKVKGDTPTYEELRDMPYLEKVLKETMRLHPIAPVLNRICSKEFTCRDGTVIKPGETILIPVQSIHLDPVHWPDPLRFDPERFESTPKPGTYLAFGAGPRICIAMRFAMMEMKLALATLLRKYNFELSKKTQLPLKMHPRMFLTTPVGGIIFHVTKL